MKLFNAKVFLKQDKRVHKRFAPHKRKPFNLYRTGDGFLLEINESSENKFNGMIYFEEMWYLNN